MARGGSGSSYRVALATEFNRVACIRVCGAVIVPLVINSRHRQRLGYLLHSLRCGHLTAFAVGHRDGVVTVSQVADGVSSIAKRGGAAVGGDTGRIPSHRVVRGAGSQIQRNETISGIETLAIDIRHRNSRLRIHRHRSGRCCRTFVTIFEGHRNGLGAHSAPLSRNSVVFTRVGAVFANRPHIIGHTRLRGEAEGGVGFGSVDTDIAARQSRNCQVIHCDVLGGRCRVGTTVGVLVVYRNRLAARGVPLQRNDTVIGCATRNNDGITRIPHILCHTRLGLQRQLRIGGGSADTDIVIARNGRSRIRINHHRMLSCIRVGTAIRIGVVHRNSLVAVNSPLHRDGISAGAADDITTVNRPNVVVHTRFRIQTQHIRCIGVADTDDIITRNSRRRDVIHRDGGRGGSRTVVAVGNGNGHRLGSSLSPVCGKTGRALTGRNRTVRFSQCP